MNATSTLTLPADGDAQGTGSTVSSHALLERLTPLIVMGGACITFGILWDISWHATIGRDTFWTPAHMLIYVGGAVSGLLAGVLAFAATFLQKDALRGVTVGLLGARAPLGAWVTIWGALAMLTSGPLDDWWHNTYGLDVKILSPPHALLAMGMYGVVTGAHLLASARRNRAGGVGGIAGGGGGLVVFSNGIQLALSSILLTELSWPNLQHTSTFAMASAAMYPGFLVAAACHRPVSWAATRMALVYVLVQGVMVWILPLWAAEPKLAPIYNPLTHMAPPAFPLLLFVPALALDGVFLLFRRRQHWGWQVPRVVLSASLFLALFLSVQWHFSAFLISPAADNWFFAGHGRFFSYMSDMEFAGRFWRLQDRPLTGAAIGWAWLIALVSASVGLGLGEFLKRIRR
jgi:hypothetical protein